MPEPESRPAPATPPKPASPRAPGFGELLEQSLLAVVDPSVFRRAAARPAPSFGVAGGLALAAGAATLAAGLAYAVISSPELLRRFTPPILAALGAAALGVYALLVLLFAAALYGIGKGFGGGGDFDRGLQAAAMISVLAPLQMLCNWFPFAWIAPALLAAWAAAGALEGLFDARPGPVRSLCVLLAAGGIGLQAAGRALTDRALGAYGAVQAAKETVAVNADLARSMSALAQRRRPHPRPPRRRRRRDWTSCADRPTGKPPPRLRRRRARRRTFRRGPCRLRSPRPPSPCRPTPRACSTR
jgi:hypothetical protein